MADRRGGLVLVNLIFRFSKQRRKRAMCPLLVTCPLLLILLDSPFLGLSNCECSKHTKKAQPLAKIYYKDLRGIFYPAIVVIST